MSSEQGRSKPNPNDSQTQGSETLAHHCAQCARDMTDTSDKSYDGRHLFVEEEVGRAFCSEDCISQYFASDVEKLEQEYFRLRPDDDLTPDERAKFSHFRWVNLKEPSEVWAQKLPTGDIRYTLISEFKSEENESIWMVCLCLFLRGEPSFLYLAFPTSRPNFVNAYRRGEKVTAIHRPARTKADGLVNEESMIEEMAIANDGLAEPWTESESARARLNILRTAEDIQERDFKKYEKLLQPTLAEPDECWAIKTGILTGRTLHMIKEFEEGKRPLYYIVVAREIDPEEMEVIDAFPTKDEKLVSQLRVGEQEMGEGVQGARRQKVSGDRYTH